MSQSVDRPPHPDDDITLRPGSALPVLADGITARIGLAEDTRPVRSVRREQIDDLVGVCSLPGRRCAR